MDYQIALIDHFTWAAFGPCCFISGLSQFAPLPEVTCPILDIRDCDPAQVLSVCHRYHPAPDQAVDVDRLILDLVKRGAKLVSDLPIQNELAQRVQPEPQSASLILDSVFPIAVQTGS
jgi:hypothetical protein